MHTYIHTHTCIHKYIYIYVHTFHMVYAILTEPGRSEAIALALHGLAYGIYHKLDLM